jgi:RecB family endonuclease NucS
LPGRLSLEKVKESLMDSIKSGKTAFLVCSCEIDYVGRARSRLGRGERMIIFKEDGTLIVHQKSGRNPVNWMPPKSRTEVAMKDGVLSMVSTKYREKERMVITVDSATSLETFRLADASRIEVYGTEKDFVKELLDDPSLIEKGFRLTRNERVTIAGSIDISGLDSDGNPVAVEVKRSRATPQDVVQLQRYVDSLRKKTDQTVRGILVAPSASSKARRLLVEYDLEIRRIHPLKLKKRKAQADLSRFVEG